MDRRTSYVALQRSDSPSPKRLEAIAIPTMVIEDAPRFEWHGVMIDVARHFYSLSSLKRQIDAMELVKLNVLHLYLSDNEGFRVESCLYPKLHEASSPEFYSQFEIRELVSYSADRGVRIVPEFDIPGHSLGMLKAYPEYASGEAHTRDYFSAMGSGTQSCQTGDLYFPRSPVWGDGCVVSRPVFPSGRPRGQLPTPQALNELADAAPADNLVAHRFA